MLSMIIFAQTVEQTCEVMTMYEELVSRLRNTLTLPPFACATMNEAADAIESLDDIAQTYAETVQELKMKSQWIPVTEENNGEV